jgi:hypothetical protein
MDITPVNNVQHAVIYRAISRHGYVVLLTAWDVFLEILAAWAFSLWTEDHAGGRWHDEPDAKPSIWECGT